MNNALASLIESADLLEAGADKLRAEIGNVVNNAKLTTDLDYSLSEIAKNARAVRRTLELAQALTREVAS